MAIRNEYLRLLCIGLGVFSVISCKNPDPLPMGLEAWELALESLNDLETEPGKSRISLEDGKWVADLRDLPLWSLPLDGGVVQISKEFPHRARVDGAHLCGKLDRRVERWLDTAAPGWKKVQKCDANDLEKSLRKWEGRKSGVKDLEFSKDTAGRITGAKVGCRKSMENELEVGRLQILPDLRSLELEDCRLATMQDSSGATSLVQGGFAGMKLRTLRLRRIQAPFLDLSDIHPLDTLEIQEGDATALLVANGCPREIPACRDKVSKDHRTIRLVQSKVCDPPQVRALQREGAVFEEQRCQDVPQAVIDQADSLAMELGKLARHRMRYRLQPQAQVSEAFAGMTKFEGHPTWSFQRFGDLNCVRPYRFVTSTVEGGRDWIDNPFWGRVHFGTFDSLRITGLVAGGDRQRVEGPWLPPFLQSDRFDVQNGENGPEAVFVYDKWDRFEAFVVPQGCSWTFWKDEVSKK
ncbi:MAG: hypothetical protein IPK50_05425 [Fibrobacterota bacterium]|nr:hypothetical protein [Fibrobacterota bacterium]QQS06335.1 MAG: hypothetical protein IPK50_05425 [Fibrobacterota bacterium]